MIMQAAILSIGSELVLGQVLETNGAWLCRQLARIGIPVVACVTVGDDLEQIRLAIAAASKSADVVLVTGGLGPTEDDLTRTALARALGTALELDQPSLERVREFFAHRGRAMPERNKIQAMFPKGAEPIVNTCGTAPGIRARLGRARLYLMPGVPREMRTMFERDVLTHLVSEAPAEVVVTEELHCFGLGESTIAQRLGELMQPGRTPAVGTGVSEGIITVRITDRGPPQQVRRTIEATIRQVRARLGDLIFGCGAETLASAVAQLLVQHGKTVCTAESCTGGLIAQRLTDLPGSSAYFLGSVVAYSNQVKTELLGVDPELIDSQGAVSARVAQAMAVQARAKFGSHLAVAVTGIAGPTGGSPAKPVGLVYIALADADRCRATEHRFGPEQPRPVIRDRTASTALNMLRLHLLS